MKKIFATLFFVSAFAFMVNAQADGSAGGNTYLDQIEGLARAELLSNGCFNIAQPNIAVQYSYSGLDGGIYTVTFGIYSCGGDRCRLSPVANVKFDTEGNVLSSQCNE